MEIRLAWAWQNFNVLDVACLVGNSLPVIYNSDSTSALPWRRTFFGATTTAAVFPGFRALPLLCPGSRHPPQVSLETNTHTHGRHGNVIRNKQDQGSGDHRGFKQTSAA